MPLRLGQLPGRSRSKGQGRQDCVSTSCDTDHKNHESGRHESARQEGPRSPTKTSNARKGNFEDRKDESQPAKDGSQRAKNQEAQSRQDFHQHRTEGQEIRCSCAQDGYRSQGSQASSTNSQGPCDDGTPESRITSSKTRERCSERARFNPLLC